MHIASLLRYYPPAWRERYEDEVTDVLAQHRVSFSTWIDLVRGAVDAHLDPSFAGRMSPSAIRLRRSETLVFCSFIAFVVAGIGFQKMTEDADKAGLMQAHFAIGASFYAVIAGAVIALLAIVAGALPIALVMLRQSLATGRRDILALLAVPPVLFIAIVAWGAFAIHSSDTGISASVRGLIAFFIFSAAASAAAVSLAAARSELNDVVLRLAQWPARVATAAMGLSLIGVVAWGISLHSAAPSFFALDSGTMTTYAYFTWLRVVVIMALATVIALAALWRTPSGAAPTRVETATC
jgi:hypothetical protein